MHHTWKLLTIIFIAAIVGLGIFAANNPNLQARFDRLMKEAFGERQASSANNGNASASSDAQAVSTENQK